MSQTAIFPTCELCGRAVEKLTVHHLIPRSQAKAAARKKSDLPTALLCAACHKQLHVLFSNKDLARELSSLEEIKAQPSMQKFLDWVRRQDPNKKIRVRR